MESSSIAAPFKHKKRKPIHSLSIARQHPLAYGLLLMQNARLSPSSCLPASGERPFNRTCASDVKKESYKASKPTNSISFLLFLSTTSSARSSPLPLFPFPSSHLPPPCRYFCLNVLERCFQANSVEHLVVFPSGRRRGRGYLAPWQGRVIVRNTGGISNGHIVDYKTNFLFFYTWRRSKNNPKNACGLQASHSLLTNKLVSSACKQQKLLLFPCGEDAR